MDAVRSGKVDEATLDETVRRILQIVFQARSDGEERTFKPEAGNTPEHRQIAREAADEAVVLLKNEGKVLPIRSEKVRSIAVFGPNAAAARIEGGGSANVTPYYGVTPLDAIRERAGKDIRVDYAQGAHNQVTPAGLTDEYVQVAGGENQPGIEAAYYPNSDFSGQPALTQVVKQVSIDYRGLPDEVSKLPELSIRWHGTLVPPTSGEYTFSLTGAGRCRLLIDGQMVVDHWTPADIETFWNNWPFLSKYGTVELEAGQAYGLQVEFVGSHRLFAGFVPPLPENEQQVSEMAAKADIAIVVAGTTWEHETEGRDREDWNLPGDQVALIRRVTAANPRTVVVLNTGAPVEMASWIKPAAAVMEAWFNGQELGHAIADVLFGDVNPSGKLPDTLPVFFQDNPSYLNFPGENGHLLYGEGIFVGYRYYDAKDIDPLFPFGFGLSYTTFEYSPLAIEAEEWDGEGTLSVSVDVTNTGKTAGKEIVQLYVRDPQSRLQRPSKELKGFRKILLQPGETQTVTFQLTQRDLSYYDPAVKAWAAEPGEFNVLVGASSRDIRAEGSFLLFGEEEEPKARFTGNTRLSQLLENEQARAVLEKHIPDLVAHPQFGHVSWATLNWASMAFMELLPPEKVQAIVADLAKIE